MSGVKFAQDAPARQVNWLRGLDLNQRPSGYEPDELPGCSTPRDNYGEMMRGIKLKTDLKSASRTVQVSSGAVNSCQKHYNFFFINSTVLAQKVLQSDALKPMRILIADDQAGVGNTLALLVSAAKHHVVKVVSSGAEAIRAYRIYKPDVVLMDYSMGRLNGGTACRYILTEDPAARIVFVSGRPATDLADIGAVAFLPKPVELKDLQELLNNIDTQLVFDYARAR